MDIKYLIKNFQLVIAVALLFTACSTNDTQKKISTQLSGKTLSTETIKNLSTGIANSDNKHIEKINQNEINFTKNYSFEEYVNSLLKNNKSKEYPDINNIPD